MIHQKSYFETVLHYMSEFRANRMAVSYTKNNLFRGVHQARKPLLGLTPVLNVLYIFPLNWPDARCHNFETGIINEKRFGGFIDLT